MITSEYGIYDWVHEEPIRTVVVDEPEDASTDSPTWTDQSPTA